MKVSNRLLCAAKQEPRAWARDGRSGVIYRIFFSDGKDILNCTAETEGVYNAVEPFKTYEVVIDYQQMANGVRTVLVSASPVSDPSSK